MKTSQPKIGKIFLTFAGLCVIAIPFVIFMALSHGTENEGVEIIKTHKQSFDEGGKSIFKNYDRLVSEYIQGTSSERTLDEYYSRRQYLGSPPYIPHKVEAKENQEMDCLSCHAKGGWSEELKRNTPVTPHPEHELCQQCHIAMSAETLFGENDWVSVQPPRLGRSYLAGGPPPIPHDLQMRGDCIACHVGPGTVAAIRVDHPSRGNCRQCHVPDITAAKPFTRESSPN